MPGEHTSVNELQEFLNQVHISRHILLLRLSNVLPFILPDDVPDPPLCELLNSRFMESFVVASILNIKIVSNIEAFKILFIRLFSPTQIIISLIVVVI